MKLKTLIFLSIFAALFLFAPIALFAQPKARVQRTVVCTGAGSATAATCTPSPALSALSDLSTTPRTLIHFTPTASTTGALTLAINGLTATAVVKYVGGAAVALAANDLRSGTSYLLEYDGSAFVVKSVLGNGGGGGGTGDVVGPASAADNEVAIYDSTTGKLIKRGTGCTIASATLTCTGGFVSGDGTAESAIILRELAANGTNDFRIYGAANQAADGCLVFSGALASGDAWRGSASTVTIDGKTCRVMETYTPGAGGGSGASLTAGYCYLSTNCSPPLASLAAISPGAVASRVYVVQIVIPYNMTVAQVAARAAGGGGAGDGFVIGAYTNSSNAPGSLIAGCAFTDVSAGGNWKTCSTSIALTAGTPVWLAVAVENTAMSVRGYTGAFSSAFTEFNSLMAPSRIGRCANTATGTGTGLTLPPTCGSLTSEVWAVPMIVATP